MLFLTTLKNPVQMMNDNETSYRYFFSTTNAFSVSLKDASEFVTIYTSYLDEDFATTHKTHYLLTIDDDLAIQTTSLEELQNIDNICKKHVDHFEVGNADFRNELPISFNIVFESPMASTCLFYFNSITIEVFGRTQDTALLLFVALKEYVMRNVELSKTEGLKQYYDYRGYTYWEREYDDKKFIPVILRFIARKSSFHKNHGLWLIICLILFELILEMASFSGFNPNWGLQLFYRQFAKLLSPAGLYIMI